jgi:uncharacterized protein with PIN domain
MTSDLYIILRRLVYTKRLAEDKIVQVLGAGIPEVEDDLRKEIKFIKENPLCPECNISLSHFNAEFGVPEHMYCSICYRLFQPDFPYTEIGAI